MSLATLFTSLRSRQACAGLVMGLALSGPAAWAQSPFDCRRPPAPPEPPCGAYDEGARCNPCMIEPWMCPTPPQPPAPPCVQDDACSPCMSNPYACRAPVPEPRE